ncbi:MAG TPA: class I SAM-dependent methyltransferase [Lentisphaeria bacterium]|nr:class I SAM-dependent methyltransferase [Lentisphaeria bacterium]HQL86851.1 class I SAM-dependent methyltransferase [Lentisphaeria bacterium]
MTFPQPSDDTLARLTVHNRRWSARMAIWRRYARPPWWGEGLVVSPRLRAFYEACLPAALFYADLHCLGTHFLPSPSWFPAGFCVSQYHTAPSVGLSSPPSLPDFWAVLPHVFSGRVTFAATELLALYCALADLPRFGTDSSRYPDQLSRLADYFRQWPLGDQPMRLLDIGCGVGLNTLEIAALGVERLGSGLSILGVTPEPLEVWMAENRRLPHDPVRELRLRRYPPELPARFRAERFQELSGEEAFDVIVCNGLAGGRFLHECQDIARFLENCCRCLRPGGTIFLANHFHDGCRSACQRLLAEAAQRGFQISGDWQDACLQRM